MIAGFLATTNLTVDLSGAALDFGDVLATTLIAGFLALGLGRVLLEVAILSLTDKLILALPSFEVSLVFKPFIFMPIPP